MGSNQWYHYIIFIFVILNVRSVFHILYFNWRLSQYDVKILVLYEKLMFSLAISTLPWSGDAKRCLIKIHTKFALDYGNKIKNAIAHSWSKTRIFAASSITQYWLDNTIIIIFFLTMQPLFTGWKRQIVVF